jgi:putative ABC transport system ATP-binding protein
MSELDPSRASRALPLDALILADPEPDPVRAALVRLRATLRLEREDVWVVVVYAVATGALTLASPIAVQALVNTVAFGALIQPLVVLALVLTAGLVAAAVLKVLAANVAEALQQRLFVRAVADLARRLPRVELAAHGVAHGPELVNRFFGVIAAQKAGASLLTEGIAVALQAAVGMVLLAFYHPALLALDLVLVAGLVAVVVLPLREAVRTGLAESHAKYATAAWLEELMRAPTAFKSRAGARFAGERGEALALRYLAARRAHWSRVVVQLGGGLGLQVLAAVALLGVGGLLVIERQLTLGQLVAAELVVAAVAASFAELGKHLETLYDLVAALHKLGVLVDLPLEPTGERVPAPSGPARVRLRGVRCEGPRLATVDLAIAPGERVHVHARGADAAAVLELCAGLRRPAAGVVEIDDLDLRLCDLQRLREQVALVRPDTVVAGTVLENLSLGSHCEFADLQATLELVGLADAVAALPLGLRTPLLPGGAPLTRAEARRLALARALASRPRLLLLDYAVDGLDLDPPTRARLLDHVFGAGAPWTVLVVTDDPVVRARCDRAVLVAAEGASP